MADKKISQLTGASTPLAGTEVLPIVQSGATVKVAVSDLTAGRAVSAASLALTGSALPVGSGGTGTATAFTAGSVVFAGASGVYSQDNASLFFDNTNDRLGVGTATPSYRLDVTRNGGGGDSAQIARITDSNTSNGVGPLHLTLGATNHFAGNPGMVLAGTNGIGLAVGDGSDLAGQRKLTIDSSSNVTVNSGNLVIGTSGKGIDFSATPGTGTSELLADYEEGTWTPVISGSTSAGTGTYAVQVGTYTKIGNTVNYRAYISYSSHTGTGNLRVDGLPFTLVGGVFPPATIVASGIVLTSLNTICGYANDGTTLILIKQMPVGGGTLTDVAMDAGGIFFISGSYTA